MNLIQNELSDVQINEKYVYNESYVYNTVSHVKINETLMNNHMKINDSCFKKA